MNLKNFIQINETNNKVSSIIKDFVKSVSQEDVNKKSSEIASNLAPKDFSEKAKSEKDWARKFSRGEFEDKVSDFFIQKFSSRNSLTLTSSETADLKNWFYNYYEI